MKRLCVTGLLAFSFGLVWSLPAPSQEAEMDIAPIIEIYDPYRIESPASPFLDKIDLLEKVIEAVPLGDEAVSSVRETLVQAFPGFVRLESSAFGYKSIWCSEEMRFIKVCCFGATYLVDLGTLGVGAVHVKDFVVL